MRRESRGSWRMARCPRVSSATDATGLSACASTTCFWAPRPDNTADMVAKGQASLRLAKRPGPRLKLSLEVVEIRDLYAAGHIQAEISRLVCAL